MQIKTDNFEIDIHDGNGYYVDVKTENHTVTVFLTHAMVYKNGKALVHVHTALRKVEVAKDIKVDVTDEP
jgi:metal-sulfur cluster biosynthetic enzyme